MARVCWGVWLGAALLALPPLAAGDQVERHLTAIRCVGPEGAGSAGARAARDALASSDADTLPRVLAAMDSASPVAANWLRSAFESIVDRELSGGKALLPLGALAEFVRDPSHAGRARRLALAVCQRVDPTFQDREIPRLLADPEFRDDAVEMALAAGQRALEGGDSEAARAELRAAFEHARDSAQVLRASSKLAGLGENVDIAAHLGLVNDWWLLGPFEAPGTSGFKRSFPPEQGVEIGVDLGTKYTLGDGQAIAWKRHRATDTLGLVNLAQAVAPAQEAVAYAYAQLDSPRDQAGQLRCGADDNCTVWLNGQKVFAREQWLNGTRFDRFVTPIRLSAGRNRVLVKVCQGPQHKDPQVANNWSLQLRFCDESGRGLVFAQNSEAPP
jgi:hypothetical protein